MTIIQKEPLNIIIAGVGGQGNVLMSKLIGQAMVNEGYRVKIGETFGASQRGGSVTSHMRISKDNDYGAHIPQGKADIIVGLEPLETLRQLAQNGNPETCVLTNTRPIYPMCVSTGEAGYPSLDTIRENIDDLSKKSWFINASDIALNLGIALLTNVIMAGALTGLNIMDLKQETFENQLAAIFKNERLALNIRAFREGLSSISDSQ